MVIAEVESFGFEYAVPFIEERYADEAIEWIKEELKKGESEVL